MESKTCYVCGKENLSKNELGLNMKLFEKNMRPFYCLNCLADFLEVDSEFLLEKVAEFKEQGCKFF